MKQLTIASLLMLSAPVWASTSASIDLWQTDFNNGRFPTGMTASAQGQTAIKDRYKNGWSDDGWGVSALGRVYCAVSPTSTLSENPVENILTLPAISIPEEAEGVLLRWSARSILPELPESYEIRVRRPGQEGWVTIYRVEEEEDQMRTRAILLDDYAGQEVEISFVCVSVNRYMLAIGGIYVGIPGSPLLTAVNSSRRFAENASPRNVEYRITGEIFNAGAPMPGGTELKVISGEELYGSVVISETVPAGGSLEFNIPAPFPDNETTSYDLVALLPDGTEIKVLSSDVTRSGFARTLLIDEGTGIWCNNCTRGILDIASLERSYPGQIAAVCTHVNDILANDEYWSHLGFYAVPYMMLNRQRETAGGDTSRFGAYYNEPTTASISVVEASTHEDGDENVKATLEVMFDHEVTESGRYGIGYVLTSSYRDHRSGKQWMQNNILTTPSSEQYYFLPSVIPATLSFYDHVSLDCEYAFDPNPIEIAEGGALEPYSPYRMTFNFGEIFIDPGEDFEIDEDTVLPEDISLVAFVIDTEDGTVLNATTFPLQKEYYTPTLGVTAPSVKEGIRLMARGGNLLFTLPDGVSRYEMTVSDPAGRILSTRSGEGSGETVVPLPEAQGLMIVTLTTSEGIGSLKIMK